MRFSHPVCQEEKTTNSYALCQDEITDLISLLFGFLLHLLGYTHKLEGTLNKRTYVQCMMKLVNEATIR